MIVVVGSRHDPVSACLVGGWPEAALCDAVDLVAPGWRWPSGAGPARDDRRWVVGGEVVPDGEVTGVFVRRSAVYADELLGTHPDDRPYLASEALALLVHVLGTSGAAVVNPVGDGTLLPDGLRPERWMRVASDVGVAVAPLRCRSEPEAEAEPVRVDSVVEVVDGEALPAGGPGEAAVAVAGALGLRWAVSGFDDAGRLCLLTTTPAPSSEATARLGALLAGPDRRDA